LRMTGRCRGIAQPIRSDVGGGAAPPEARQQRRVNLSVQVLLIASRRLRAQRRGRLLRRLLPVGTLRMPRYALLLPALAPCQALAQLPQRIRRGRRMGRLGSGPSKAALRLGLSLDLPPLHLARMPHV
jgi:hypothetical protein